MSGPMAIGAESRNVFRGVWAVISQTEDVMNLKEWLAGRGQEWSFGPAKLAGPFGTALGILAEQLAADEILSKRKAPPTNWNSHLLQSRLHLRKITNRESKTFQNPRLDNVEPLRGGDE